MRTHCPLVGSEQLNPGGQMFSTPQEEGTHTPVTQVSPAPQSVSGFSSTCPLQLLSFPSQTSGEGKMEPVHSPRTPFAQERTPFWHWPAGTQPAVPRVQGVVRQNPSTQALPPLQLAEEVQVGSPL